MGAVIPPKIHIRLMTAKEMEISEEEYKIQNALGAIPKIKSVKYFGKYRRLED